MNIIDAFIDYQVHWLHACAHANCWAEELHLSHHEMAWTVKFSFFKATQWDKCKDKVLRDSNVGGTPYAWGAITYAAWQIAFWKMMAQEAQRIFQAVNVNYYAIQ